MCLVIQGLCLSPVGLAPIGFWTKKASRNCFRNASERGGDGYAICVSIAFRLRRIANPVAPKPTSIIAQVVGSGTDGGGGGGGGGGGASLENRTAVGGRTVAGPTLVEVADDVGALGKL